MYSLIKTRTCGFSLVSAARKVLQVTPKNESIMIHNFARIRERKIQTNCSLQLHFVFPISLPENVICFAQKQRVNKQTIIITIYIYILYCICRIFLIVQGKNFITWHLCSPNEARKSYGSRELVVWRREERRGRGRARGRGICIYLAIYR